MLHSQAVTWTRTLSGAHEENTTLNSFDIGWLRTTAICFALLSGSAGSVFAADYYVRTDGSNTSCNGTANAGASAAPNCAWATPSKCATTIGAGDRCRVQAGSYLEKTYFTLANSGTASMNVASGCSATKGSTTVTCSSAISGVSPGQRVRLGTYESANDRFPDDPYFAWSRVKSVSGSTITLDEGYRGKSLSGAPLHRANFVEFVGEGGTVAITSATPAGKPTFTQESAYPGVWCYSKASATAPWNDPRGMYNAVDHSSWDRWYANRSGRDTLLKLRDASCPCGTSDQQHAYQVFGSWIDDGSRICVHLFNDANPNSSPLQAAYKYAASEATGLWQAQGKNYVVISGFTFIVPDDPGGYAGDPAWGGLNFGGNHTLYENLTFENGRGIASLAGRREMELRNVKLLSSNYLSSSGSPSSGLRIYNSEFRGGFQNTISFDGLAGWNSSDPVVFDRMYLHRAFTQYRTGLSGCGQASFYDCSARSFGSNTAVGVHGAYIGSTANPQTMQHLLVQNSVIEITADGFAYFHGNNSTNVVIRNNTFGYSGANHGSDNRDQESLILGASGASGWGAQVYNNVFYIDDVVRTRTNAQLVIYPSSMSGVTSTNNLWLRPYNDSTNAANEANIWSVGGTGYTFNALLGSGKESGSKFVCYSGCTGGSQVTNDANSRNYFVKPSPTDGTASNYTPTSSFAGINAARNDQCPSEDFYGKPRSDGACDIGAVEYAGSGGNPPDTTPPAAVTGLSSTAGDARVTLSWTHSASSDALGTRVRFKTTGYPTGPTDGTLACEQQGSPSSAGSCVHSGLTNGTPYYYAAFSYDGAGNHGTGVNTTATPSGPPAPNSNPGNVSNNHRTDVR